MSALPRPSCVSWCAIRTASGASTGPSTVCLTHRCAFGAQVPLSELVENLLEPQMLVTLRTNYVRLLDEAFLATERPVHELTSSDDLPRLLSSFAAQLADFATVLPSANLAEEPAVLEEALFLCHEVLPIFGRYYSVHFPSRSAEGGEAATELAELGERVGMIAADLRDESRGQEGLLPPEPILSCLSQLKAAGVITSYDPQEGGGRLGQAGLHGLKHMDMEAASHEDSHPQERLLDFADAYEGAVIPAAQFAELVAIFAAGLDAEEDARPLGRRNGRSRTTATAGASPAIVATAPAGKLVVAGDTAYVRNLVRQLLDGRVTAEAPLDRSLTEASLRVLIALLEPPKDSESIRRRRQVLLAKEGVCTVALMMGACEDSQLYQLGMRLTIALLTGGNVPVQKIMYKTLSAGTIEAFDGSSGSWMGVIKRRLRRGAKEIAERKLYLSQQAERLAGFEDEIAGLSAAAAHAVRADIEREFASQASEDAICGRPLPDCHGGPFAFGRLTWRKPSRRCACCARGTSSPSKSICATRVGDALTLRPSPSTSFRRSDGRRAEAELRHRHLTDACRGRLQVWVLLAELEPEIDGSNAAQVVACISGLTEFVQGNESQVPFRVGTPRTTRRLFSLCPLGAGQHPDARRLEAARGARSAGVQARLR